MFAYTVTCTFHNIWLPPKIYWILKLFPALMPREFQPKHRAPEVFKKAGQYLLRLGSEDVPGLSDANVKSTVNFLANFFLGEHNIHNI